MKNSAGSARAVLPLVLLLASLLGGCDAESGAQASGDTFATAPQARFVLGATATANEPAPALTSEEIQPVQEAVKHGTVQLTAFVGSATERPAFTRDMSVYYDVGTKEIDTDPGRLAQGFDENLKWVRADLAAAAGNQPNLDLLGLLGVLAHTPSPATLLVHSSGLQTTGLLDLRGTGSDLAVAATLAGLPQDQLPDLTGKRVVFVGLGQVAGPQQPLTERMRAAVRELWLAVCRKAHGDCAPTPLQADGGAPLSKVAVPTIPVPVLPAVTKTGAPETGQVTTIPLPSGIFFQPDTAEFLPGAEQKLRDLAGYFRADAGMVPVSATSVGHTATSGAAGRARTLSKQRAQRVVDVLVAAGVRRALFDHHIDGVGFDQPLARDRDAEGTFLPEAAELNRTVVLTVTRIGSTG